MTLEPGEKKTLSDVRMEKAVEFLGDAEKTLKEGLYKTSINRSYYALLNATRSLLVLEGSNPLSHDGTITMLSLHFIKKGLLPVDLGKTFRKLLSLRSDVDYGDFDEAGKDEAEESFRTAKDSIAKIDEVRKRLYAEL
jgi:uncharacterized protein (UPF0332 family)